MAATRLLARDQCPETSEILQKIEAGDANVADLLTLRSKGRMVAGALAAFEDEFVAHLGRGCPHPRQLERPKLVDFDEERDCTVKS
ncbi:hypothetical protein [Fodinicola feengrottensis]|uniref:hypothetical protein n=1 Tax=Fodinicola feengrottensis TaxID=435914 RepID=UPI0013D563FC|nr:hypothetical protein [Fodinicola feengrottensis]